MQTELDRFFVWVKTIVMGNHSKHALTQQHTHQTIQPINGVKMIISLFIYNYL